MRTEVDLTRWLEPLARGRATCVFADDVEDALAVLQEAVASRGPAPRVVSLTWSEVPPLANELGLLVAALAKATVGFFPELYGLRQGEVAEPWSAVQVETEAHAITREVAGVDGGACRRILTACYRGKVPSLGKLPRGEQARQFGLAMDPARLFVFIAVVNVPANGQSLRSLAQGAEWLAGNVRGRLVLVLPRELAGRAELDHVSYGACVLSNDAELLPVEESAQAGVSEAGEKSAVRQAASSEPAQPVICVSPIVGRPATNSDAEQALYDRLTSDDELRPLFAFNQQVSTVTGQMPRVDVLWDEGKLVIEVDGPDHRGPGKFSKDRMRDYELWLTGYSVVRFTDGRVLEATDAVVEQIRTAVKFVRQREKS